MKRQYMDRVTRSSRGTSWNFLPPAAPAPAAAAAQPLAAVPAAEAHAAQLHPVPEAPPAVPPADHPVPQPYNFIAEKEVFRDEDVKFTVKQVHFQRQTQFQYSDHLYEMKIASLHEHHPVLLMLGILVALKASITEVLEKLKAYYQSIKGASDHERQIYVSITDPESRFGTTTGNFSINEPSAEMTELIVGRLYNYLISDNGLPLHAGTRVHIKVLDAEKRIALGTMSLNNVRVTGEPSTDSDSSESDEEKPQGNS